DEPDRNVAEENNDAGKEASLAGDVGLAYAQNVNGQGEMKGVGGADQKMKPDEMALPIPDQVAESEDGDDQHDVKRKEVRRDGEEKIIFGDDNVTAGSASFEFLDASAK